MGMTPRELLRLVELPLALPSIAGGVAWPRSSASGRRPSRRRSARGGLGEYIYRGLSMVDSTVILAGAVPPRVLALAVDAGLLWVERQLSAEAQRRRRGGPPIAAAAVVAARCCRWPPWPAARAARSSSVRRTSPSRSILGELLAQTIERRHRPRRPAPAEPGRHAHLRSRAR